jgi:predicted HTH domain antitoxin
MSFDIPAIHLPDNSAEARILETIIRREHVSVEEAVRLAIRTGFIEPKNSVAKRREVKHEITDEDLELLRQNVPIFGFLENLPESVVDAMEATSKQIREERPNPRG